MSRPLVTYPRVENVVVDFLDEALEDETVDVRADLPSNWSTDSTPVIVVSTDGTPEFYLRSPVAISPSVRLVAWSNSPTKSHDLVMLAAGHMEAHDGEHFTARLFSAPLAVVDPDHGNAELCAVTLRTRIRSTPIVDSSS